MELPLLLQESGSAPTVYQKLRNRSGRDMSAGGRSQAGQNAGILHPERSPKFEGRHAGEQVYKRSIINTSTN